MRTRGQDVSAPTLPDPEWTPRNAGVDWQLVAAPKDVKTGAEANVKLLIADVVRGDRKRHADGGQLL